MAWARKVDTASKYKAVRTKVDGVTFASKAEACRYSELKLLEKAGEITQIELQPKYQLMAHGSILSPIGHCILDFKYFDMREKRWRVEDVKGCDNQMSRWKRKHVQIQYGITVEIIK